MTVGSIALLKTSSSSSNVPEEIWRVVFSFLKARDLCKCMLVCKKWKQLVASIDGTRWKELYLQQNKYKRWKHPFWPNNINQEPSSWKDLYRQRYQASQLWVKGALPPSCATRLFFNRKREKGKFFVGYGKQYRSIKSAIDKAGPYDTIYVYHGIYQDSSPLVLKYPCAIVGVDDPSKVVLKMQIEIKAASVKIENLTLKSLFTRVNRRNALFPLLKVPTGHVFIFNCNFEDGQIYIISPGIVDIHSSSFVTAFVSFRGISYSSIINSKFQPDKYAVHVKEPLFHYRVPPTVMPENVGGWVSAMNEKKFIEHYKTSILSKMKNSIPCSNFSHESKSPSFGMTEPELSSIDNAGESKSKSLISGKTRFSSDKSVDFKTVEKEESIFDDHIRTIINGIQGIIVRNIQVIGGQGGVSLYHMAHAWIEDSVFECGTFGVRCDYNSKCVLLNNKISKCETSGIIMRDRSYGFVAGNEIYANKEAGIEIRSFADPIIQHNDIHSGERSGIVCLDIGKGIIRDNNIYNNKEAGIYILHRGCPKVKNNNIWSSRGSGIAVTEQGHGHISYNVISGMEWAGIDIRHGANPVISHNTIQHGKTDGIVVAESGKSVIFDNTIDENYGYGIWILDGSYPLIHSNRIINSGNSGIAFVKNIDHEHNSRFLSVTATSNLEQDLEDLDDPISMNMNADEEIIFRFPVTEQEPESRYVHVSKPEKKFAQVESNNIEHNWGHGIVYDGNEGIVISKNKICCNHNHGISLQNKSEITIENNTLSNNLKSGIKIELTVSCLVQGNGIYDNQEHGVVTGGLGQIQENDIFGNNLSAILLQSMGNVLICQNRLHTAQHACILIEDKARCVLEKNHFYLPSLTKEIVADDVADVRYETNNETHKVPAYDSGLELMHTDSRSMLTQITDWRPKQSENEAGSAPYFTSMQLRQSSRTLNISEICCIL